MEAHVFIHKLVVIFVVTFRVKLSFNLIIILVNLFTPKVTYYCYHKFKPMMIVKCLLLILSFCNKVQTLLMPWGRVSCICKTACFLANYAPHSLQAGKKMEPYDSKQISFTKRSEQLGTKTRLKLWIQASANQRPSCH